MARILATEGNLVRVYFGTFDPLLTKRQLAEHPEIRRSTRWVEMRVAEGMPSQLDGNRRMFRLSQVRAWLDDSDKSRKSASTSRNDEPPPVKAEGGQTNSPEAGPPLPAA